MIIRGTIFSFMSLVLFWHLKKQKGLDLYGRNIKFQIIEIDKNKYLPEGYEKFTFLYK